MYGCNVEFSALAALSFQPEVENHGVQEIALIFDCTNVNVLGSKIFILLGAQLKFFEGIRKSSLWTGFVNKCSLHRFLQRKLQIR